MKMIRSAIFLIAMFHVTAFALEANPRLDSEGLDPFLKKLLPTLVNAPDLKEGSQLKVPRVQQQGTGRRFVVTANPWQAMSNVPRENIGNENMALNLNPSIIRMMTVRQDKQPGQPLQFNAHEKPQWNGAVIKNLLNQRIGQRSMMSKLTNFGLAPAVVELKKSSIAQPVLMNQRKVDLVRKRLANVPVAVTDSFKIQSSDYPNQQRVEVTSRNPDVRGIQLRQAKDTNNLANSNVSHHDPSVTIPSWLSLWMMYITAIPLVILVAFGVLLAVVCRSKKLIEKDNHSVADSTSDLEEVVSDLKMEICTQPPVDLGTVSDHETDLSEKDSGTNFNLSASSMQIPPCFRNNTVQVMQCFPMADVNLSSKDTQTDDLMIGPFIDFGKMCEKPDPRKAAEQTEFERKLEELNRVGFPVPNDPTKRAFLPFGYIRGDDNSIPDSGYYSRQVEEDAESEGSSSDSSMKMNEFFLSRATGEGKEKFLSYVQTWMK